MAFHGIAGKPSLLYSVTIGHTPHPNDEPTGVTPAAPAAVRTTPRASGVSAAVALYVLPSEPTMPQKPHVAIVIPGSCSVGQ